MREVFSTTAMSDETGVTDILAFVDVHGVLLACVVKPQSLAYSFLKTLPSEQGAIARIKQVAGWRIHSTCCFFQ